MNFFQGLGVVSLVLLAASIGISAYLLTGRRSKAVVYTLSRIVLAMVVGLTAICAWITLVYW